MEQWKEIEGYEGLYWVSDQGRVKNREGKILKSQNKDDYLRITLSKNNIKRKYFIHRVVALAFIPTSDPEKTQVNHKDENKFNNRVDNLEWCTAKYNSNYGTRPEKISINKSKKVLCIETGETFKSARYAAKYYNLNLFMISNAANPNQTNHKTAAGFHWQYIN